MATIVIMPGGFHPFHAGHYALYRSAVEAFPDADVYVAATNDTSARPFPFPVKEKLAKLAGVPANRFVQVKSPFKAEEITAKYNPEQDVLIFVRSDKDAGSPPRPGGTKKDGSPSYLQPWTGKDVEPFAQHAYMAYLPTVEFGPGLRSATEIRTAWPQLDDRRKTALVMSLYPRTQSNPKLAATVRKMLDTAIVGDTLSESAGQVDFSKNLLSILQQKYPDAEFRLRSDGVESADGQLTVIASAEQEGQYVGCLMWDVSTGPYKGALAPAIKQTTDQLLQANPGTKPALFISGDNQNPEAWRHIAKKLRYKLIADDDLEENQGWAATYEEVRAAPSGVSAGMTAGYQRRENQPIAEKHNTDVERDPELKQARLFAKQHYPEFSGDEELAYDKWVQRSIQHGLEDDQKQFKLLQGVAEKIKRLERTIAAVKQQRQQQTNEDYLDEKWSEKYKRSINCSNPRGFSQRAHCAGRKK